MTSPITSLSGFSRLRKVNRDPVTTARTMTKRIFETVRQRFQLIERILRRIPIMVLINEGDAPTTDRPLVAGCPHRCCSLQGYSTQSPL
jgi:hypothetical protein